MSIDIKLHKKDLPDDFKVSNTIAIDCEMGGLNVNRDPLFLVQISCGDLDAHIIKDYNRMFEAKGYGAASILGEACGACYTSFPPQLVSELKDQADFKYCPSCNILVYLEQ